MLDALAVSAAGQRMPALQRFLRAGLVELIAALQSKTPLGGIFTLFESRAKELEEAKQEARNAIPVVSRAAFWEATI